MKRILATVVVISATLLGHTINAASEAPFYDGEGRLIAYKYGDGTRELYAYDGKSQMTSFVDRAGKVSRFSDSSSGLRATGKSASATATPIDSTLYILYGLFSGSTYIDWLVCGSTEQSSGCYGTGSLGPFGKAAALVEGEPKIDEAASTVTRYIYVLDIATGANQDGVTLYVYQRTDTVTPSGDSVTMTLSNTVNLHLVGGTSASGFMAANKKSLFIGTDQFPSPAVQVRKKNLTISTLDGGISVVSAITADPYGFITVTQGSFGGTPVFYTFDPNGSILQDGGGGYFMLNTVQSALPSTFP